MVCAWCAGCVYEAVAVGGGVGSARRVYGKVRPGGVCFVVCVHRRVSCRRSIPVGPYSCRRQPLIGHSLRFSHGIG